MRSKSSFIRDRDSVWIVNGAKAILSHGFVVQSFFINFFKITLLNIFTLFNHVQDISRCKV